MVKKLLPALAAVVLVGACAGNVRQGPFDRQAHWNMRQTDDGVMVVRLRTPAADQDIQRVAGREKDVDIRDVRTSVEAAADNQPSEIHEAWPDVFVKVDKEDGVVYLQGHVDTEEEAVAVIDSALKIRGVVEVHANITWPGRDFTGMTPHSSAGGNRWNRNNWHSFSEVDQRDHIDGPLSNAPGEEAPPMPRIGGSLVPKQL